jgi:hypothetical protein
MTPNQVAKLEYGVYRLHWKEGGSSLAAVGGDEAGWRWYAPCNWVTHPVSRDGGRILSDWASVASAVLIRSTKDDLFGVGEGI